MVSKVVPVVVSGAAGRMGGRILELAGQDSRFRVVGGLETKGNSKFPHTFPDSLPPGTVLIDFTTPHAALGRLEEAIALACAMVIGTTGFTAAQKRKLASRAQKIPCVISPNMSAGIQLLAKLARQASMALPEYDLEIIEAHHRKKQDAPSGTALFLSRETGRKDKIPTHSIRAGGIVGDHTILLAGPDERLELTHRAGSRDAFARGALRAAAWVGRQRAGLYSMADVLEVTE